MVCRTHAFRRSLCLGKIVMSNDEAHPVGKAVSIFGGIAEYVVVPVAGINPCVPDVPVEMNLGPFSLVQVRQNDRKMIPSMLESVMRQSPTTANDRLCGRVCGWHVCV